MREIEFFFDCSSPWTYLGFVNVQRLAAECGARIRWRPFMVGGVFNEVNPTVYEARRAGVPAKQAYYKRALQEWARWTGVALNMPPSVFPVNTAKVMRICLLLDERDALVPFATAAFEAYFVADQDLSDASVVAELCRRCGHDAQALLAAQEQPAVREALRRNTSELIARGGFGSPTIFVGERMFFGNDHLPLVRQAIAEAG